MISIAKKVCRTKGHKRHKQTRWWKEVSVTVSKKLLFRKWFRNRQTTGDLNKIRGSRPDFQNCNACG